MATPAEHKEEKTESAPLALVKFSYANAHLSSASQLTSRDFYFAERMIEIEQSGKSEEIATRVWDASIVLSHYLDTHAHELQISSKVVLEIGAGLGLCSIVCSLLNAKHVYLTDIDAHCLQLAQQNIERNKCSQRNNISVHEYYWGAHLSKSTLKCNRFDLVIGADCIYLKDTYKSLIQTFTDVFKHNPNALIILAFADRFNHQHIFYKWLHKNKAFCIDYIEKLDIDLAKTNKIMTIRCAKVQHQENTH